MIVRETLVAGPGRRGDKELVAAGVARANACPYCLTAHAGMAHAAGEADTVRELFANNNDGETAPLLAWAAATTAAGSEGLRGPPFSQEDGPGLRGTAVVFHYVNRLVNVFCSESPLEHDERS